MSGSILYMGDTALDTAAAYLAGLMTLWRCDFDYVPSDDALTVDSLQKPRSLFILSDYASGQIDETLQRQIIARVADGAGLLMIGGWESFHGLGGDWDGTPIAEILPVEISRTDDRLNCDHPILVRPAVDHAIVNDLPWNDRPPLIGGLNRTTAKSDATTVLTAEHFRAEYRDGDAVFSPVQSDPLLVVGTHGKGRTAALMTDVAPHWVGPLVDWGPERITAQAAGAGKVEVGSHYAQLIRQLLTWTANAA